MMRTLGVSKSGYKAGTLDLSVLEAPLRLAVLDDEDGYTGGKGHAMNVISSFFGKNVLQRLSRHLY